MNRDRCVTKDAAAAGARPWRAGLLTAFLIGAAAAAAEPGAAATRIMRFVSQAPVFSGSICYGLVWDTRDGVPTRAVNLGYLDPAFCATEPAGDTDPAAISAAFDTGDRVRAGTPSAAWIETIAEHELADRVLPPAGISAAALASRRRVIVGVGLNYAGHRDETGADQSEVAPADLLFFPKATPPTGAYAPVPTGLQLGTDPPEPVILMDYEAEIGLVLLAAVDLDRPPPAPADLRRQIAYFTANDVSDRTPIILDSETGFARGKSHGGYLPVGPWMVHGRDLDLKAGGSGARSLRLQLAVSKGPQAAERVRQSGRSEQMVHGPWAILNELARRYQADEPLCMPDAWGRPVILHDGRGRIPEGSILLTGTPGGTAIRAPGFLTKLRLFVAGGFSIAGARQQLVRESREAAPALGYLGPDHEVRTSVDLLGRQVWRVVPSTAGTTQGVAGTGGCDGFRPVSS